MKLFLFIILLGLSGIVIAYTAPSFDSVDLVLDIDYTAPSFDSVDLVLGEPTTNDSCTYTSGDWDVDCSDNCVITSNVNIGGNNLILDGVGSFFVQADIINIGGYDFGNATAICKLVVFDGNQLVS